MSFVSHGQGAKNYFDDERTQYQSERIYLVIYTSIGLGPSGCFIIHALVNLLLTRSMESFEIISRIKVQA